MKNFENRRGKTGQCDTLKVGVPHGGGAYHSANRLRRDRYMKAVFVARNPSS